MGSKQITNQSWQQATDRFIPWINRKAKSMVRPLPYHVAQNLQEELVSAGYRGLVEGMHRVDPKREQTQDAFIRRTITGAMLDEMRALDPLSRGQRKQYREMRAAERELTGALGRPPTTAELARATNKTIDEFQTAASKSQCKTMSLDAPPAEVSHLQAEMAQGTADTYEVTLHNQRRQLVRDAIDSLPKACRTVVSKYYFEGKSLQDIGAGLSVCDARASQLRKEGVQRLQRELVQRMAA